MKDHGKLIAVLITSAVWISLLFLQIKYSYREHIHLAHPYNQCVVVTASEGRKSGSFLSMQDVHNFCQDLAKIDCNCSVESEKTARMNEKQKS